MRKGERQGGKKHRARLKNSNATEFKTIHCLAFKGSGGTKKIVEE